MFGSETVIAKDVDSKRQLTEPLKSFIYAPEPAGRERGRGRKGGQSAQLQKQLWSPAVSPHLCHAGPLRLIDCLSSHSLTASSSIKSRHCGEVQVWGWELIVLNKLVAAEFKDVIMENCSWVYEDIHHLTADETVGPWHWHFRRKHLYSSFQWLLFLRWNEFSVPLPSFKCPLVFDNWISLDFVLMDLQLKLWGLVLIACIFRSDFGG